MCSIESFCSHSQHVHSTHTLHEHVIHANTHHAAGTAAPSLTLLVALLMVTNSSAADG